MVMSSAGLGPKVDSAAEAQQQPYITYPLVKEGAPY
jgi:hypothetical protein